MSNARCVGVGIWLLFVFAMVVVAVFAVLLIAAVFAAAAILVATVFHFVLFVCISFHNIAPLRKVLPCHYSMYPIFAVIHAYPLEKSTFYARNRLPKPPFSCTIVYS